jgi:hypothetical protein
MQSLMETILCNSIVAEDVVVVDGKTDRKICRCADVVSERAFRYEYAIDVVDVR